MHTGVIDVANFWPRNFIGISEKEVVRREIILVTTSNLIILIIKRDAIGLKVSQNIT